KAAMLSWRSSATVVCQPTGMPTSASRRLSHWLLVSRFWPLVNSLPMEMISAFMGCSGFLSGRRAQGALYRAGARGTGAEERGVVENTSSEHRDGGELRSFAGPGDGPRLRGVFYRGALTDLRNRRSDVAGLRLRHACLMVGWRVAGRPARIGGKDRLPVAQTRVARSG